MEIINQDIDGGKGFDWGRTSNNYAKFRDIYPAVFYEKIIGMGLCVQGQRVLDLGTGTGVLPRNLSPYGADFIGADIAANQIDQARRLAAEAGLNISFVVSAAETLEYPDEYFDTVTACQCYDYFDKKILFPQTHRFLKDGGHFCILFMAWLVEESAIAAQTEKLILKYNPAWTGHSLRRFKYDLPKEAIGLFTIEQAFTYDVPVTFTRESWHGRMKTCRGIGASSLSAAEINQWENEHQEYLSRQPESFEIPHFVTVLNLRKI